MSAQSISFLLNRISPPAKTRRDIANPVAVRRQSMTSTEMADLAACMAAAMGFSERAKASALE